MSSLVNELGICCKIIKVLKYSFNSLTKSEPKKKNAIKASKRDSFSHQNTTAVSEKRCRLSFDWCLNVFNLFYFRYSLIRCLNGVFVKKTIDCKLKNSSVFSERCLQVILRGYIQPQQSAWMFVGEAKPRANKAATHPLLLVKLIALSKRWWLKVTQSTYFSTS